MNNKKPLNIFSKNFKLLKIVFSFCPLLLPLSIFYILSTIILSLSKVYLISKGLELIISGSSLNDLIKQLVIIVIVQIISLLIKSLYEEYLLPKQKNIYIKKIQKYFYLKAKEVDMEEYDNPIFFNRFSLAFRDSQGRGFRVFQTFLDFISLIFVAISIAAYITIISPILIIVILSSSIISIFFLTKASKIMYKLFKKSESDYRFSLYVNRTFYLSRYAPTLKVTSASSMLIDKYIDNAKTIEQRNVKYEKQSLKYQNLSTIATTLFTQAITYLYLGYQLFKNIISIANFSSLINATLQFSQTITRVGLIFVSLRENALYIDDFLWVVDYKGKEQQKKDEPKDFKKIELKNITFKYNNTEKEVLKNLNLTLLKNNHIAIVGLNGSGKTTLIKLILGFYKPTKGVIYYNGKSYEEYNKELIRKNMAAIFQDYQIYATTIAENVLMRKVESKDDETKVIEAIKKVGLYEKVKNQEKGIYTLVTKEFDKNGFSLSIGEAQKIAIARVLASDASIYILDEATASLDPLSEEKINRLIMNEAKNKTIIIISHRLSSVVDAKTIYLLENGSFVEKGNHQQLLEKKGKYYKLFQTQKELYVEKTK